jgi:hypothetical protein
MPIFARTVRRAIALTALTFAAGLALSGPSFAGNDAIVAEPAFPAVVGAYVAPYGIDAAVIAGGVTSMQGMGGMKGLNRAMRSQKGMGATGTKALKSITNGLPTE